MSYNRKTEDKRRLKSLYDKTQNSYGSGAYYSEYKDRLIRASCHDEWFKTYARRVVRRKLKNSFELCQGCKYKKMFDYWWRVL